jgi:hypothetical protein
VRLLGTSMCHLGLQPELQLPGWKCRVPTPVGTQPLQLHTLQTEPGGARLKRAGHARASDLHGRQLSPAIRLEQLGGNQKSGTYLATRQPTSERPRGPRHSSAPLSVPPPVFIHNGWLATTRLRSAIPTPRPSTISRTVRAAARGRLQILAPFGSMLPLRASNQH